MHGKETEGRGWEEKRKKLRKEENKESEQRETMKKERKKHVPSKGEVNLLWSDQAARLPFQLQRIT